MKFLLFAGEGYYPRGGADDYQGAFASVDEAKRFVTNGLADQMKAKDGWGTLDWAHIAAFDGKDLTVIAYWSDGGGWMQERLK